jgi:tripartite-type tricarboxylate transporter receptor subunit TctC
MCPIVAQVPAIQDLAGGQIDILIDTATNTLPQIRAGNIKAYAIAGKSRVAAAPEVPTVDEAGLPGFYASVWFGLWVPARTPQDIIARINAATVDALADAAVHQRIAVLGQQIVARDQQMPEALRAFQKAEIEKWWPIIKAANIKPE